MSNEVKKEEKPLATDKEIIDALALDLVQLAQLCNQVMARANFNVRSLRDAELLGKMCTEILDTFITKEEVNEESENLSNEAN